MLIIVKATMKHMVVKSKDFREVETEKMRTSRIATEILEKVKESSDSD